MGSGIFYPLVQADDGSRYGASSFTIYNYLTIGNYNAISYHIFVRFPNVTIPAGAIITNAFIRFTAQGPGSATVCNEELSLNDVDNAVAPTNYSEYDALVKTTAKVDWTAIGSWSTDVQYDSVDITIVLQEVIDRAGWSSGNAVMLLGDGADSDNSAHRLADVYSGTGKAELHVTWASDTEITLPTPFFSETSLQSNIQVELVPGALSVEASMSIGEPFWGTFISLPSPLAAAGSLQANTELDVTMTPLIAQTNLQSNIQIEIVPPSFAAQSELSIGEIFCGIILSLPGAFEVEGTGQVDAKVYLKKIVEIFNPLGDQSQNNIINSFGDQLQNNISAALGLENRQPVRLDLSPGAQFIQELIQKLCIGDPFTSVQTVENKLVNDKRQIQALLKTISGSIERVQAVSQTISQGEVIALQKLLSEIAEKDFVVNQQRLLQSLQSLPVTLITPITYDVLLDGVSIKNQIKEVQISYREDSVHNSIEISSISNDLFWKSDPADQEGISRLEVRIESRQIYFLLEKRSGNERSFSLWGRSLSAREDSPYAEDLNYTLTESKTAKSIVEEILTVSSLDWQCDNWSLPVSFEFEGTPLEGISQIAAAIGAVIRCEDDGTICVRQRFPVRPVDMIGASAAVNYDRTNLTRLEYDYIKGTQFNAIEVEGYTGDVDLPDMSIEESSPVIGNDVYIRVYWAGKKPDGVIETYVTDGTITLLGETTAQEETETVIFEDGISSVSMPITSLVNVEWIGDNGGSVTYEKYSKDMEIGDDAYRIGNITYTATYSRYRLHQHNVELLLALLSFGGESDVSVEIKIGEGDRPAPKLSAPLLTSESIAVVAGTAWLDDNKYNLKKVGLKTPFNEKATDGALAYINDAEIDCTGTFHIRDCDIIISGAKVINQLGVVQCQV